jgi:hypothetical protein
MKRIKISTLFVLFTLISAALASIFITVLHPLSSVEAQQSDNFTRWEYITVDYSQNQIIGTMYDIDADVSMYELIFVDAEPYASLFSAALTEGCTISDETYIMFDEEVQKCIGGNFIGREFVMNALGADGWELIQIDNNSTEYSYKVDMVFKRQILD